MADKASVNQSALRVGLSNKVVLIAALAISSVGWTSAAHAQLNLFSRSRGPVLPKADIDARSAAAQKLLNDDPASVGQAESWTGPKSGNQGTLTIRRVFERSGMPCRSVESNVVYKQAQTKSSFTLTACRLATGEWKLAD